MKMKKYFNVAIPFVLAFALLIGCGGKKSNDKFKNATVITSTPFTANVDTTKATSEPSDPIPPCGLFPIESVWFQFTPSADVTLTADTNGSDYDTVLSVWTGSPGSFSNVACDDDGGSGSASLLSFAATSVTTYNFMVTSFFPGGGNLVFHLN